MKTGQGAAPGLPDGTPVFEDTDGCVPYSHPLRRHYGGYCFDSDASVRVYQPWSVIQFLSPCSQHEFSQYWLEDSGVSYLLSESASLTEAAADGGSTHSIDRDSFMMSTGLGSMSDRLALLAQCGYFTIKQTTPWSVRVGLPNLELRSARAYLLSIRIRDESGIPDELTDSLEDACLALHRESISAEELAQIFSLSYKVLSSRDKIVNEYAACYAPALYCLGSGYDVRTGAPEKGGCAFLTFDFLDRRIIIGLECVNEGESAEEKLGEAEAQASSYDCGPLLPGKPLRRFAMVFSVPRQRIVLSKEAAA